MHKRIVYFLSILMRYNVSNYDNPQLRYSCFIGPKLVSHSRIIRGKVGGWVGGWGGLRGLQSNLNFAAISPVKLSRLGRAHCLWKNFSL